MLISVYQKKFSLGGHQEDAFTRSLVFGCVGRQSQSIRDVYLVPYEHPRDGEVVQVVRPLARRVCHLIGVESVAAIHDR